MSRPRLTEKQKAAIVKAYKAGEPVVKIAGQYKVATSYPGLLAARRGLPLRRPKKTIKDG